MKIVQVLLDLLSIHSIEAAIFIDNCYIQNRVIDHSSIYNWDQNQSLNIFIEWKRGYAEMSNKNKYFNVIRIFKSNKNYSN